MRIVAGRFRGRPLQAPVGSETRPTADRVREALFSMLASRLGSFDELRVADLFAGSGALGFEALSRGAAHVTFVENDRRARSALKANAEKMDVTDRVRVVGGSALALPRSEAFDLILADPPYVPGSGSAVAKAIAEAGWLAPGGWLSIETDRREAVESSYKIELEREIGRARITLLRQQ